MYEELNVKFSLEEITHSIKQLKLIKSGGPVKLIIVSLVCGRHVLVPTICNLLNKIFGKGHFPAERLEEYIVPLHKKGSFNDVEN